MLYKGTGKVYIVMGEKSSAQKIRYLQHNCSCQNKFEDFLK